MELTRITKLLLWLLSKRPEIDNIGVRDATPADCLQDLDFGYEEDFDYDELYGDLTREEQRALQTDFLNDCFLKSFD